MDPELQKQLAEFVRMLAETASDGRAFVMAQAPLVIQERVLFARIMFPIWALAFTAASGWMFRKSRRLEEEFAVIAFLGSALLGFAAAYFIEVSLKAWITPRLYVLEWAMDLVAK